MTATAIPVITIERLEVTVPVLSRLCEIEVLCFPDPMPYEEMEREFKEGAQLLAVKVDGIIAGYCTYMREGPTKRDVRIESIAVEPRFQRRGLGSALIDKLYVDVSVPFSRIMANVRESNLDAQLFLRKVGFKCVPPYVLKNAYGDFSPESAYIFSREKPGDEKDKGAYGF